MKKIKAYKVFNPDWTLKHGDTVFEVGKSYHQEGIIKCCANGYHACTNLSDCFKYYNFDKHNKFAEVELSGNIDKSDDDTKICASDLNIIREITWEKVIKICNHGSHNTGFRNTGDLNSGDWNSGDWNSGDHNSGNCNTGDRNTGDLNSGVCNTGDRNSGYRNSGFRNTGDLNSGFRNTGDRNSGNYNSGDHNSGDRNSGDWNSGDWNSGDWNSGFFNTKRTVFMFNKDTGKTLDEIDFPNFLYFDLTVWVSGYTATEEEMKEHKQEIETCGGFLKTLGYKEAFKLAWDNASREEHEQVKNLPNFDADIFYQISGIDVRKE